MGVIFDLDQTIIDSSIASEERRNRNWRAVYNMIPEMQPYQGVVRLINKLVSDGVKVAIVTSSPRPYCEKVLDFLGITGVVTVCYHDTQRHKPDPEPLLLAIERMGNQEGKQICVIGDEENDIIAAKAINTINVISILAYWGNPYSYYNWNTDIMPSIFLRDEESLLRFFNITGIDLGMGGLRERTLNTYQLFDYYPISRAHDMLSTQIFQEVKRSGNQSGLCTKFCRALEQQFSEIMPQTYGIFVVPSSTEGKWNSQLVYTVVPRLIISLGLIDCSKHILRHKTHEKQAFGGDRSIQSNLSTIKLQYAFPEGMIGALIIDDITTTGNIFEACKQLICDAGIPSQNIYCAAIGGTI